MTRRNFINTASWAGTGLVAAFGLSAIAIAIIEGLRFILDGTSERAAPPVFLLHAFAGGVGLFVSALQIKLVRSLLAGRRHMHRALGRIYVTAALITSAGSLPVVANFDVSRAAKLAFAGEAVLWFATTAVAFRMIRQGRVPDHREWMIRSYALALFFVTGGIWLDVFEGSALYPLGVVLSWLPNLIVAEWWIRRTRSLRTPSPIVAKLGRSAA